MTDKKTKSLVAAALAGLLLAGAQAAQATPQPSQRGSSIEANAPGQSGDILLIAKEEPAKSQNACKGLNACKGKGGCKTGDKGCAAKNSCKGKGGCATAKHECKGKNTCKSLGGCKTGDKGCAGKNTCKGKGGCATPVKHK